MYILRQLKELANAACHTMFLYAYSKIGKIKILEAFAGNKIVNHGLLACNSFEAYLNACPKNSKLLNAEESIKVRNKIQDLRKLCLQLGMID